jgi:soluble lytic murein transglycosylase-like protein
MKARTILLIACMATIWSGAPAAAQQGGDFSAKRVKPPEPGARKRITVQIAPRAEPAVPPRPGPQADPPATAAAAPVPSRPRAEAGDYAWYWSRVSPDLAASGPGRLPSALAGLAEGPGGSAVASPRLQALQDIAAAHGADILRATVGTQVSPALALAVIAVESSGRDGAVSHAGAQGLMQLMPATAERFGVPDPFEPTQNIRGGVAYLDFLMQRFDGDPVLALAGYNAGENAIPKHDGVPPYAETRDYVPKVLAAFRTARGLCLTPPELASDGCVFRVASSGD